MASASGRSSSAKRSAAAATTRVSSAPTAPIDAMAAAELLAAAAIERLVARSDLAGEAAPLARSDEALNAARAVFANAFTVTSPLSLLVANAGLHLDEAEVLAVAICVERDDRLQKLLVHLHSDGERGRLEVGTVAQLFDETHSGALTVGPQSMLRRSALIEVSPNPTWSRQVVTLAPSVMWALIGDRAPDPDLVLGAEVIEFGGELSQFGGVLVTGPDRIRRRGLAGWYGTATRYLVSPPPTDERGWAALVREATLFAAGVMIELDGALPPAGRRRIEQADHLAWVLSSKEPLALDELPAGNWRE
ncbi:MAG TPA: hypothetical protein VMS14_01385, partial [Ilumatobacteraceae bacterium]|nr:hypothetical protein [Ilumatobacteraceae bacterium]